MADGQDIDLETLIQGCEREEIQLIGSIQPHGVLLHVDRRGVINFISQNGAALFGRSIDQLLGSKVSDLFPLPSGVGEGKREWHPNHLRLNDRYYDLLASDSADGQLLELLPTEDENDSRGQLSLSPHALLTVPESEEELLKACNELARQVGSITGCQRVLVYRFCHDWSGEVVAESCRDERRFTGLRFPASDIPARVRELYLRISQRLIPDMAAAPVPVIGRQASARLDLTYSDLRSVPDVHRIYMGNMGVVAAFSIAVLVHGRLWGIVSAHHPERRYLSWGARQRVADAVQLLGLALSAWQSRERIHALERLEKVVYPTLSGLLSIDHLVPTFLQSWTLVELLGATGSVLMHEDRVERLGEVPDAALNGSLKVWLDHKGDDLCLSERLAEDSLLDVGDSGAGLLAIRVHYFAMGRRTTLYWCWFRPEEATEVRWAGRPEKEVSYRDGTPYLTPRRSFDLWVEVTRGQSRPWSHFDQLVGRKLRTVLLQRLRE